MRAIKLLVGLLLAQIASSLLWAATVVPGGVQVTATYTEPNTNVDGTVIKDLWITSVYFSTSPAAVVSTNTFTKAFDVPATSLSGGGNITKTTIIPWSQGKEGNVSFFAVAVDTNGLVSAMSSVVVFKIDTLAPGAPKVLQISDGMLFYQYREPFLNSDGVTPVSDLLETRIYFNDSVSASIRLLGTYPATSSAGGGAQTASFPLTSFVKGSKVRIFARFYDTNGNVSAFPQPIGITIPQ